MINRRAAAPKAQDCGRTGWGCAKAAGHTYRGFYYCSKCSHGNCRTLELQGAKAGARQLIEDNVLTGESTLETLELLLPVKEPGPVTEDSKKLTVFPCNVCGSVYAFGYAIMDHRRRDHDSFGPKLLYTFNIVILIFLYLSAHLCETLIKRFHNGIMTTSATYLF